MNFKSACSIAVAAMFLTACNQNGYNNNSGGGINKADVGMVTGAVIGGVLGSKVGKGTGRGVAIGVGTLLGAGLGRSVGESLDRADMAYYNQTSQQALETSQPGQTLPWSNPQSGNSGTVTPYNYYQTNSGQYCREYSQTINVGGRVEEGYGRACRQPDGTWQIVQ